jgi:hypothetical protein
MQQTCTYGMEIIPSAHTAKFLGIIIDNNLSWHTHTDQMISRLNNASYVQ